MKDYRNPAGETPADVANFLLADLRTAMRGNAGGQLLCDSLQQGIIAAIVEAVDAHRADVTTRAGAAPGDVSTVKDAADVAAARTALRRALGPCPGHTIDLRPAIRANNAKLLAMARTLRHAEAVDECCHCTARAAAGWSEDLIRAIDTALALLGEAAPSA